MADRTWNPVDSKLYDEDWSQGAIIVAACLIARCPNQYGIFDMPWGFLTRFHTGVFDRKEIEGFCDEWESARFVKFYKDRKVVWIVKKFKRSAGYINNIKHAKGLVTFLCGYPEIKNEFYDHYNILSLLNEHSIIDEVLVNEQPIINQSLGNQKVNNDVPLPNDTTDSESLNSETDSGTDSTKNNIDPKSNDSESKPELGLNLPPKPDKPKKKKEPKPPTSNHRRITDTYQELYVKRFGKKPPWSNIEGKRIKQLLKHFNDDVDRICQAIRNAFGSTDKFLSGTCGSFMTLTATAIITKADTITSNKTDNQLLDDSKKFEELGEGVVEL